MSHAILNRATDLLPKYMVMGNWKSSVLKKGARASRTASKRSRIYTVTPPKEGWPGGHPKDNGYKAGGK